MKYLEEVCDAIGKDVEAFKEEAIKSALGTYLDCNGEFHPRKAYQIPTDYEKTVAKNEGNPIPAYKTQVLVIEETSMYGSKYYKCIEDGHIMKCPAEYIVFPDGE